MSAVSASKSVSAKSTTKTQLCKYWENGQCNRPASECNFAHGVNDLRLQYCWFFNQPNGCSNKDCKRLHEHSENVRKPLTLIRACYALHVDRECPGTCSLDHYELTKEEWNFSFPSREYPGEGYLSVNVLKEEIVQTPPTFDEFPPIGNPSMPSNEWVRPQPQFVHPPTTVSLEQRVLELESQNETLITHHNSLVHRLWKLEELVQSLVDQRKTPDNSEILKVLASLVSK